MASLAAVGIKLCLSAGVGGGFWQEVQSVMLLCVAMLGSVGVVNHPEMCRLCAQPVLCPSEARSCWLGWQDKPIAARGVT